MGQARTSPAGDEGLLRLLREVESKNWDAAVPGLRVAADTVTGSWISEVHAGLARAALADADPAAAWHELELGRLRYLASRGGSSARAATANAPMNASFDPGTDAHPPIPLESLRILLSGANATLIAFGDSRILAPLCMVIHADGEHAFAIESDRVRNAWVRGPGVGVPDEEVPALLEDLLGVSWSRIPPTTQRVFIQPPVALWNLPFAEAAVPRIGTEAGPTLGDRYPVSLLPWSTVLSWASAPRTRSGDGLAILGGEDDEALHQILGGQPRNTPIAATVENLKATAPDADVIYLRGRTPRAFLMASHAASRTASPTAFPTASPAATPTASTTSPTASPTASIPERTDAGTTLLHLDDADLTPGDIASISFLADLVLLESGRFTGSVGDLAAAFIAGGARCVLALDPSLADSTAEAVEHELYMRLRTGTPRDRAVHAIYRSFEEEGHPLPAAALQVWGPGHLPVYSLTAKRGIGALLLSWVIFLGTGFFLLRFFVRRFLLHDPADRA